MKATVQPGNGVVERTNGNEKIVTAALGSTDKVEIALDSSVGLATMAQAAVANITATLGAMPAAESLHAEFDFSFPEAQQDHFTVLLDKALALVKLDVPGLKSGSFPYRMIVRRWKSPLWNLPGIRSYFQWMRNVPQPDRSGDIRFSRQGRTASNVPAAIFSTPDLGVTPQPGEALRQVSFPADALPARGLSRPSHRAGRISRLITTRNRRSCGTRLG